MEEDILSFIILLTLRWNDQYKQAHKKVTYQLEIRRTRRIKAIGK